MASFGFTVDNAVLFSRERVLVRLALSNRTVSKTVLIATNPTNGQDQKENASLCDISVKCYALIPIMVIELFN